MAATTSLLYRLGIEGDEQVKARLVAVGGEEEKQVNRAIAAADRKFERIAQIERQLEAVKAQSGKADDKALATLMNDIAAFEALGRSAGGAVPPLTRVTQASGQQRAGMQQLSFQLNDVAVQFAAGTPAMTIFAQQSGQVIQAVQMMTGGTTGLAAFLGGPWGMALTSAAVVMTPFVAKLFEESDASKAAREALEQHRRAVFELAAAKEKALITGEKMLRQEAVTAEQNRLATILVRNRLKAELELLKTRLVEEERRANDPSLAGEGGFNPGAAALAAVSARMDFVTGALAMNQDNIDKLTRGSNAALSIYVGSRIDALRTPEGRIDAKFADPIATAKKNQDWQTYDRLSRARDSEREAIAKSTRREPSLGAQVTSERGGELLAAAMQYRGLGERTDKSALASLFGSAGITIDPEKTAWCAAFVNAVLAQNGIKGSGSLSARSLLGVGTATNTPVKGDVVVTRRGSDPNAGHVGFYDGLDARGRVRVLGGNTSDKVGVQAFDKGDVLGFRRVSDATRDYTTTMRDAAKEADELLRLRDALIKQFDPEVEATERLTESLDQLARVRKAGLIDDATASKLRMRALIGDTEGQLPASLFDRQGDALDKALDEYLRKIPEVVDALDVLKLRGREAVDNIFSVRGLKDFEGAFSHLLESMADDLLQLAVANPLKNMMFGGDARGNAYPELGGGLFGSIFGGLLGKGKGGGSGDIAGSLVKSVLKVPKLATGTAYAAGGWADVGELGPERVFLPRGSRVMSAAATRAATSGSGTVNAPMTFTINAQGAGPREVDMLRMEMQRMERALPGRIVSTVAEARARRVLDA